MSDNKQPRPGDLAGWQLPVRNLGGAVAPSPHADVGHPSSSSDGPAHVGTAQGTAHESTKADADQAGSAGLSAAGPTHADGEQTGRRAPGADEQFGEDDQAFTQGEIRRIVLDAMRTYGARDSAAYVVGGTVTAGAVVGGNVIIHRDGRRPAMTPMSQDPADLASYFVQPGGYGKAAAALRERGLVVLRSPSRWGATTTALALLAEQGGALYQLQSAEPLSSLRADDIVEGSCVLADGLLAAQAAALRPDDLRGLSEILARRSARMVLVLDTQARVDVAIPRHTVGLDSPPPAAEIVARHLARELARRGTNADADVLSRPELVALLTTVNQTNFDVLQLVELAVDLAEMAAGRATWEDVATRFGLRTQRSVREWLDGLTEPQLALTVALAALHGLSNDVIAGAAKQLEDAFAGERGDRADRGRPEPRHARLVAARAVVTTTEVRTRYGPGPAEVLSFVDRTHPAEVLRYVWTEYDSWRALLMRWLGGVAEAADPLVRVRAAATMGFLAQYSFDEVRRNVIVGWARSGDYEKREQAVAALALPARDPRTREQVQRMVQEWCATSSEALRLTGARALGISVGETVPAGPDELLGTLAKGAAPRLGVALGDSIAELMVEADLPRCAALLAMVVDWTYDIADARNDAGIFGFLEIASTLWTERTEPDGTTTWWPTLLAYTDPTGPGSADVREHVVQLWTLALAWPRTDVFVHRVLRRWARVAETHEQLRAPLVGLLSDTALRRPRLRRIVLHHARTWRGDDHNGPDAPVVAARLLDILSTTP